MFAVVWLVLAPTGGAAHPRSALAASNAAALAVNDLRQVGRGPQGPTGLRPTRWAPTRTPARRRTSCSAACAGKNVLLVFVESYGRSAVMELQLRARHRRRARTPARKRCSKAGFAASPAFLTSTTFGGGSWLSPLQRWSPVWTSTASTATPTCVNGNRFTLARAFKERRLADLRRPTRPTPATGCPRTQFYGYDSVYDSRNVG